MKSRILWWVLGGLGVLFILSSLSITIVEYNRFSPKPATFPPGSVIAGVPVGGLDNAAAEACISDFYNLPLVLQINGATVHARPDDLGLEMDIAGLVQEGMDQIQTGSFWAALCQKTTNDPVEVPFAASVDENQLLVYLTTEIASRYAQPGIPLKPIPFTTNFRLSSTGEQLDMNQAVTEIEAALLSPTTHQVTLLVTEDPGEAPTGQILEAFLRHNINWIEFDGLVEVYLESMETSEVIHFAVQDGVTVEPGVAFTAASTIKIPIMISVLRRLPEPTPEEAIALFEQMIVLSENPAADTLMETYLDEVRGPLIVTGDMALLGMENTFLAGYFYLDAPVLQIFETHANTRTDVDLDPDPYIQIVPAEAGQLMTAIYQCAMDGSGPLTETFPGEITQGECQLMVDILSANLIGMLIEAGLPPEGTAAHKHGWVIEPDGLLHSMSDVAIVFTPGGDYVLNIFIYDPVRLDFDQGNRLIARLSQTVYNFYNLDNQAHWWFD
jgi:hypothetical protein